MVDDDFRVLSQSKITRLNMVTRKAEVGWLVDYADNVTGVHSQVWVPENMYPQAVQQLIRDEIEQVRYVHNLGTPQGQ